MKKMIVLLAAVLCVLMTGCGREPVDPVVTDPATPDTPVITEATEPTETEPVETTLANDRFDPAACAKLIGTWQRKVVLDGSLFNLTGMEGSVEMVLVYQLNADGTYTRGMDPEEYRKGLAEYENMVESFMLDRLYAKFKAEKLIDEVDKDDIPKLWEGGPKASAQEQAKRFVDGLYLDYRFSSLNRIGDYYEENGMLRLSRDDGTYEACGYVLTEKGLTITDSTDPTVYHQMKLDFPLLLTKKA